MELFENLSDSSKNLLPCDGILNYYGRIFKVNNANYYFERLLQNVQWSHDHAIIFGKLITTKRKVAWYGDEYYEYTYSKTTKKALMWTKELLVLRAIVEEMTNETYNSCLLNLYHSGDEGMAWHNDAEKDLKKNGAIASISLGAERKFVLKHKETSEKVALLLEHGSLLVMKGTTQSYWLHSLPKSKKVKAARVNLTFRTITQQLKDN